MSSMDKVTLSQMQNIQKNFMKMHQKNEQIPDYYQQFLSPQTFQLQKKSQGYNEILTKNKVFNSQTTTPQSFHPSLHFNNNMKKPGTCVETSRNPSTGRVKEEKQQQSSDNFFIKKNFEKQKVDINDTTRKFNTLSNNYFKQIGKTANLKNNKRSTGFHNIQKEIQDNITKQVIQQQRDASLSQQKDFSLLKTKYKQKKSLLIQALKDKLDREQQINQLQFQLQQYQTINNDSKLNNVNQDQIQQYKEKYHKTKEKLNSLKMENEFFKQQTTDLRKQLDKIQKNYDTLKSTQANIIKAQNCQKSQNSSLEMFQNFSQHLNNQHKKLKADNYLVRNDSNLEQNLEISKLKSQINELSKSLNTKNQIILDMKVKQNLVMPREKTLSSKQSIDFKTPRRSEEEFDIRLMKQKKDFDNKSNEVVKLQSQILELQLSQQEHISKVEILKQEIIQQKKEINKLNKENHQLDQDYQQVQVCLQQANNETEHYKNKIEEECSHLEEQNEQLQKKIVEQKQLKNRVEQQNAKFTEDLKTYQHVIENQKNLISKLQQNLAQQFELSQKQEDINLIHQKHQKERSKLEESIKRNSMESQQEILKLQTEIQNKDQLIQEQKEYIQYNEEQFQQMKEHYESNLNTNKLKSKNILDQMNDTDNIDNICYEELKNSEHIQNIISEITIQYEEEIATLEAQINDLQQKYENKELDETEKQKKQSNYIRKDMLSIDQKEIIKYQQKIQDLEYQINQKKNRISYQQQEINEIKKQFDLLEQEFELQQKNMQNFQSKQYEEVVTQKMNDKIKRYYDYLNDGQQLAIDNY